MKEVYLLFGGNLGNVLETIAKARKILTDKIGEEVRYSSFYRTAAWGKTDQPDFLNQVAIYRSALDAEDILQHCLDTEKFLGRERSVKNASRTIDIDILFYGGDVIDTKNLKVPHPLIPERKFVLTPLAEIAPFFIHPILGTNIKKMLKETADKLSVKKI